VHSIRALPHTIVYLSKIKVTNYRHNISTISSVFHHIQALTNNQMNLRHNSDSSTSNEISAEVPTDMRQKSSQNVEAYKDMREAKMEQNEKHRSSTSNNFLELDSASLSATDCKNAGNRLCSLNRYEEALYHYAKAIQKRPDVAIYYSNKALCHLKLLEWSAAIQDCRYALELDPNLIKAHYFLGQALAEIGNYEDSLRHLQRANELAKEKKLNFGDDIACQIRSVKRRRWNKIESEQAKLEEELKDYLVELIQKDRNEKKSEPTTSGDMFQKRCDTYIEKLENIFDNLKLQRKRRDVPDYLCGKISFEIMRDPVITPSGVTYDRHDIEEHLRRVGHFDPITRQPLTADQLISNLAMKDVVDAYLNENEWANFY